VENENDRETALCLLRSVAAGDLVAGHLPNARHVTLEGCGHYQFVDAVAGFLAEDAVRL
jgi:hypothetical protein